MTQLSAGHSGQLAVVGGEPRTKAADPLPGPFQVLILGPLEAWHGNMPVDLGPPRQQALLGLLALRADEVVSRQTLLSSLWDGEPPSTALTMIQSAVSRLRRALAPASADEGKCGAIMRVGTGYRLQLKLDGLDSALFSRLRAQARALAENGALDDAYTRYEQALGLWRGEPLAGLEATRAHPEITMLLTERADAIVDHAAVASELGHHDTCLRNLRKLTADEPFDERAHACLMLTLAGIGNQAAALDVYDRIRRRLADQLGISPGAGLRAAHARVLRQQVPVLTPRSPLTSAGLTGGPCGWYSPADC
jgi:DNA-binding SARP family transcriptional activator